MHREELTKLPSDTLLSLARNPAAQDRKTAIEILVERGSTHACHPDIHAEARAHVIEHPRILKKIDPVDATFSARLPGVTDVLDEAMNRTKTLASSIASVDAKHGSHHEQISAALSEAREEFTSRLRDETEQRNALATTEQTERESLNVSLRNAISDERETRSKNIEAVERRLALLERSIWRKTVDCMKSSYARLSQRFIALFS